MTGIVLGGNLGASRKLSSWSCEAECMRGTSRKGLQSFQGVEQVRLNADADKILSWDISNHETGAERIPKSED
jgi:hypothetical protein